MYDYWLGGKDNFAADREAEAVIAVRPGILRDIRENRKFLIRAENSSLSLHFCYDELQRVLHLLTQVMILRIAFFFRLLLRFLRSHVKCSGDEQ